MTLHSPHQLADGHLERAGNTFDGRQRGLDSSVLQARDIFSADPAFGRQFGLAPSLAFSQMEQPTTEPLPRVQGRVLFWHCTSMRDKAIFAGDSYITLVDVVVDSRAPLSSCMSAPATHNRLRRNLKCIFRFACPRFCVLTSLVLVLKIHHKEKANYMPETLIKCAYRRYLRLGARSEKSDRCRGFCSRSVRLRNRLARSRRPHNRYQPADLQLLRSLLSAKLQVTSLSGSMGPRVFNLPEGEAQC